MFCYTCERFIKKGHGKNIYWYAGEYRYYCFPCLRKNYCNQKISERHKNYFSLVHILTLILSCLTYFLVIWQVSKDKSTYFSWLALVFGLLPVVGALIFWHWKIKPKLNWLAQKDREPILKEQARIKQLESFICAFKKEKDFCHCLKCLVSESERIKSKR